MTPNFLVGKVYFTAMAQSNIGISTIRVLCTQNMIAWRLHSSLIGIPINVFKFIFRIWTLLTIYCLSPIDLRVAGYEISGYLSNNSIGGPSQQGKNGRF